MIRASHLGAIAERPQVVKKQEVEPAKVATHCKECDIDKPLTRGGVCGACRIYRQRNGTARPRELILIELEKRNSAKWCMTCGNPDIFFHQQCIACITYWRRHKKHRPRWLWDEDFCCSTCGFPKKAAPRQANGLRAFRKDKCLACYHYKNRHGKPRPEHLWGKGSKGWCDCGSPAEHEINKIAMCNRCVKEYR